MYTYQIGIPAEEHDAFTKESEQTNLLQSSNWAKIKDNWGNERIGFYQDGILVASASILIKPLPLGFTMLYIPRGPIMDYSNLELVTFVVNSLKEFGKTKRALFVKFDPALLLKQFAIGDDSSDNSENLLAIENLIQAGCEWTGRTQTMADSIQPRFQANVYTKEDMSSSFPKHTRRLMKDAKNRGVIATRGTMDDLKKFSKIVELTENRKGVSLRNQDYFHKMMTIYGDDARLHVAKVNLPRRLAQYQEQLAQIETELAQTDPHQKKRLTKLTQQKESVEKYIKEFQGFVERFPGEEELIIAGILSVSFGNVMEMLYAGMDENFKKFYPQYILYPQVFQDAYEDGIIWANMGGVEGSLDDGLTKFKSNFNPKIEEFIGEFNIPVNKLLYKLSNTAYTIRKQLRNRH
ncbi:MULTISPECIES: aminoacyltransferase [unclassified Streptococcus]|uniref:aminoacyltransferase n=1 Tax=unclassified Streptococcus TaxID=2608887 RepID=UPI0010725B04|nr:MULTISPECIES: aminoacyltransferase [unclassified Streptococcus]MBF0805903.1 aminoacyltransferase [Streptococcus sp. 19428wA2_WM07]TFU28522.1 aminoacyltransferase [Streptococcus sp. WM07]